MKRYLFVAVVIGLVPAPRSIEVHAQSTACTVEAVQAKAPTGTTITGAEMVAAAGRVPAHCRVDGHATSTGNEVNFRLALPEGWNGKFLFLGVGGLGGTIANLSSGLMRGYASASTDTGHVASEPDWWSNRAKEIDYGYRGTHVTAVASKALTASFYGQPLQHATGATHAAAWCDAAGALHIVREDVGRHNALDKMVGALARAALDAGSGLVAVTSRASVEMVQKTVAAGVPVLAAMSAPTALAVASARSAGLLLAGFVRDERATVYCGAERVIEPRR